MIAYLKARFCERSTWAFWLGAIGSVAVLPHPYHLIFLGVLFAAGFLPDGTILPGK